MNVYFVRHGESELTEKTYQLPETPLSHLGIKQAKSIAKRFTEIPIELILSSTYLRAIETAQEIKKIEEVPIVQNDLFVERRMPSSFLGKKIDDAEVITIHETIRKHFYEPNWHYADEENFSDLIHRAEEALKFVLNQEKENIIVVTHGYFLTVLMFYILFSENMQAEWFTSFRKHIEFSLTGLSIVEYQIQKWKILSLNDYAHLEENNHLLSEPNLCY